MPKHSRPWLLTSIAKWKSKLSYATKRLAYWKKKKNKRYVDKWTKEVAKAQKMLKERRAELDLYRKADKEITSMDSAGIDFLVQNEGLRTKPYNDSQGHATIGIGHLLHYGPVTDSDKRKWAGFTEADAKKLFKEDVKKYEDTVNKVFKDAKLPKTQNRFNACVSFCFNIGTHGFENSTVARKIKSGDSVGAAEAFMMWKIPAEIIPRRLREKELFLKR